MTIANRTLRVLFLALALCLASAWLSPATAQSPDVTGMFTDKRDGRIYKTIKIGTQTWMAENLNIKTDGSWCYDNKESNCDKYGRLYNWNAAKRACPAGWHLPTRMEWDDLEKSAGGKKAGKALKSSSGWNSNGNGTDAYGFSALPGGARYGGGIFDDAGYYGFWWAATEYGAWGADYRYMYYYDYVDSDSDGKSYAFSVRCVGDRLFIDSTM